MNADIAAIVAQWEQSVKDKDAAVEKELNLRALLCTLAFPDPRVGTNNAPLGDGRVVKGKFTQTLKVDSELIETKLKLLPGAVARSLIKWKASLSKTAYDGLEPAHKTIINEAVTLVNDRPQVEIVTPKVS